MQFLARIEVSLRPSVLDPVGAAVESSLHQLGHPDVHHVRMGKLVQLTVTATDPDHAQTQVKLMCEQLLANPVIENYTITLHELSAKG